MTVLGSLFLYEVHRGRATIHHAVPGRADTPRNNQLRTSRPGELPCFRARGLGFEKAHLAEVASLPRRRTESRARGIFSFRYGNQAQGLLAKRDL